MVGLDACWVYLIVGFGDGCFSGWVLFEVVVVVVDGGLGFGFCLSVVIFSLGVF